MGRKRFLVRFFDILKLRTISREGKLTRQEQYISKVNGICKKAW